MAHIPFEDRPQGCTDVLWRFSANPVIPRNAFPCAALTEGDKIAVYYGAADTVTALCFGYISEILKFIKENAV